MGRQRVKFQVRSGGCVRVHWLKMGLKGRPRGQGRDDVKVRKKRCCLGGGSGVRQCFLPGCLWTESGLYTYFIWLTFCLFFFLMNSCQCLFSISIFFRNLHCQVAYRAGAEIGLPSSEGCSIWSAHSPPLLVDATAIVDSFHCQTGWFCLSTLPA